MAITFVGAEKTTADGASLAVTVPSGHASGDVAVFVATVDSSSNSITLPSGFTSLFNGSVPNAAVGSIQIAVGYKVMGGSEPASYTVTFGSSDQAAASCEVWRGVDNGTPLDVAFDHATTDHGSSLPACPSLTTVTDGAALITVVSEARGAGAGDIDLENYYAPPAGTSEVVDANWGAGSSYAGHAVGWDTITSAGSTGTRQWTLTVDVDDDGGWAGSLALRPASTDQTVIVGLASETASANAVGVDQPPPPVADITFVASEKATGNGTSAVVSKPTGTTDMDVGVLVATGDSSSNSITLPSGWTQLFNGDVPNAGVGPTKIAIGYRVMGASEPSSWTVTYGVSDAFTASISVWRGVNNDTPLDVTFAFDTDGTNGAPMPSCPSLTTVTDKAALINIVSEARGPLAVDMDTENYYQPPAGITEVVDANESAGSGYTGHAVGWELISTAGSTGTRTWDSIDNNDGGFAGSLALRPAETETILAIGPAGEGSTALSVTARQNTRVVTAFETDAATPLKQPRTLNIGLAQDEATATQVLIQLVGSGVTDWTDWSEYSVAQNLLTADWTLEEGGTATLTVQSDSSLFWGRRARFDLTNAGSHSTAVWNDAPSAEDWDVLILTRRHEADTHVFGAAARWNEAADTGYIGGPNLNTTEVTIRRQTPTGTSTVVDAAHRGIVPTNYFWCRLRIRGTTTRLRVWQANTALEDAGRSSEPSDWDIDTTDAEITGEGVPGIHFRQVGTTNRTMDVGWFGYGTGDRTAPGPASERIITVGLATEASTGKRVEDKLASRIDTAAETDTAPAVLAVRSITLDLVTGTNTATGVTFESNLVVHTATETSTATGILAPRTLLVGLATEADTAGGALAIPAQAVGKVFETSAATSMGGAKLRTVGATAETAVAFSVGANQTSPDLVNRARDRQAANPVRISRTFTVGQAAEANAANTVLALAVTVINVGLAAEASSATTVAHDKVVFLGVATEVPVALRLNSGLPPFWWEFYDQAEGKPAKRKLRPLVFTDAVDGQHYVIMRNSSDNLLRLEAFTPKPWDEVYSEHGGPTIESEGRLYRLYVSGGVLRFERSLFEVRTRPILFGKVARPKAQEPRYELIMPVPEA